MTPTATAASPAPPPLSRRISVETPEHVTVGYDLADLGSRFTALLVDGIIVFFVLVALWIVVPLGLTLLDIPGALVGWTLGGLVLLTFAIAWGYFIYYEGFRDGRTPGKRRMGIRTVMDGGYPVTLRAAVIRNLLRIVDIQPAPSWGVGGVAMLIHPRTKRLGDMAAGTLVVRDRSEGTIPEERPLEARAGRPLLTAEQFDVLERYVARREGVEPRARRELAATLAERLEERAPWDRRHTAADSHLVALHAGEAARRAALGGRDAPVSRRAVSLVREQRDRWTSFAELLATARRRGLSALSEEQVLRFAGLYREVAADLARARTYGASPELLYRLERMVAEGHNLVYRPESRIRKRLTTWLAAGFPALVRARWRPMAVAVAAFYLPALISFAVIVAEPDHAREVLPPVMMARAEEGAAVEAAGGGYVEVPEVFMPLMASGLIANNVQVTFVAFAGGILAGLGTLCILLLNGVFLGATAGLFHAHGLDLHLWSFVLPHGVIELTAIVIAGGAGVWMGSALVLPGRLRRGDALVERGKEAASLLAGTTLLLILAGMIEGFVSPGPLPRPAKLVFAAVVAAVLALYLLRGGAAEVTEEPSS